MTNVGRFVGLRGLCELGQTPLPHVKLSVTNLVVRVRIHATDATHPTKTAARHLARHLSTTPPGTALVGITPRGAP